jgi:hypothetical protein
MPFNRVQAQAKIGTTVVVTSPIHTTAVLEQDGKAASPPTRMTIPHGTRGEVVNALEGGRMMPDGTTRREWLVVIRFDVRGQSVLDWFGEEKYRDALEDRSHP